MFPEISASKVAGLIGLHKYQEVAAVMYELLCKDKEIKARIQEMEKLYRRKPFHYVLSDVMRDQSIRDIVDVGMKEVAKTEDVASVLEDVENKAKIILELRCDKYTPEVRGLLAAEVRGRISKQRGLKNENAILDQYEVQNEVKVVERNTKMCKKAFPTFKLIGRTDGYVASENRIVDSKDRTRYFESVPIYDEIQLRCYMEMTGATESELVERFPDGRTRYTKFMNDAQKWKIIEEAIEKAVVKMNTAVEDDNALKQIVFENTVQV
jgi:hypothetical protein